MKKQLAIIGAGPAALLLAAFLDSDKFEISIYEKNKAAGRKFLVAGKGGFNLTHSEDLSSFLNKYNPVDFLEKALHEFSNKDLINWLDQIGIPTFVGTSKRVYPVQGIKPIEVLQKLLMLLEDKQVKLNYEHEWNGWTKDGDLNFKVQSKETLKTIKADFCVFALGGSSWKVTGSDGSWKSIFSKKGISTKDFRPMNCAYKVDWSSAFLKQHEGKPLKNLAAICDGQIQKGEAVITKFGLEGNAIYGLSPKIDSYLSKQEVATIILDLKPMFSENDILRKLEEGKEKKRTELVRKALNLNGLQLALIKELISKSIFMGELKPLSKAIKNLQVALTSSAPIDEAISTIGGVDRAELKSNFELHKIPRAFCIGEMLDWNAPTGGYLLQACFSMGVALAKNLNKDFL